MKKIIFALLLLTVFQSFADEVEEKQNTPSEIITDVIDIIPERKSTEKILSDVDVPYIECFSYIKINEDNSIDVGPIFFGRYEMGENGHAGQIKERHLKKGDTFIMSDGYHASRTIKFLGIKDEKIIFEETSTFNAVSFGGGVSKEIQKKFLKPYTFAEFSKGREIEVFNELLTYFDEYAPLYKSNMDELSAVLGPNPIIENKYPLLLQLMDKDAIEYLLSKGADINTKNNHGENIIYNEIANHFGGYIDKRLDLIRFYIEKGINIAEPNNEGKTILNILDERIKKAKEEYEKSKQTKEAYQFWDSEHYEHELDKLNILREMVIGPDNCTGLYDEATKRCYNCESSKTPSEVAEKLCKLCPEREIRQGTCQSTKKTKECHSREGHWYMRYDYQTGEEIECEECPLGNDHIFYTTTAECNRCPDRTSGDDDDYLKDCYSCLYDLDRIYRLSRSIPLNKRCPSWIFDKKMGQYHVPQCPQNNQILGTTESEWISIICTACDKEEIVRTTADECTKCPNREFIYGDPYHKRYGTSSFDDPITGEVIEEFDLIQEGLCIPKTMINGQTITVKKEGFTSWNKYNPETKTWETGKEKQEDDIFTFEEIDGKRYIKDGLFFIDGNINTLNPFTGNTLLMDLIEDPRINYDEIEYLLKKGIDTTVSNNKGETAISLALKKGDHIILDLLKDKIDINTPDENGETFLHYIIRNDYIIKSYGYDLDFVLDMDKNPDVMVVNKKGENIFHFFARILREQSGLYDGEKSERFSDIAKFLVHAHAPDSGYAICDALTNAGLMGMEVADTMSRAGADLTNILICPGIWETDWIFPEKLNNLIRFGANVNAYDPETGMTPLKYAIQTDSGVQTIELLKRFGAKN